ncbi:MAG: hypothetical protein J6Y91_06120 [Alphaproteobacteria bacterium]|nr:hypothetical protein [Alphaproteobacteria bacterium]
MGYFCVQKTAFFIDEGFVYVHSNGAAPDWSTFTDKYGTCTYRSQALNEFMLVQPERRFNYQQIYKNLLVHPPVYYILFHTISSFFPDTFSKWFGLSLNLVFFAITQILFYFLCQRIFQNKKISLLTMILYGFSIPAISTVVYIRSYMLLTLGILWFCILCTDADIYKDRLKLSYKRLAAVFGCIVLIGLTHYYFFITAFFACAMVCFFLLLKRKFSALGTFIATSLAAVGSCFVLFPPMASHLLESERGYSNSIEPSLLFFDWKNFLNPHMLNQFITQDMLFSFFPDGTNLVAIFLILGIVWGGFRYLKDKAFSPQIFMLAVVTFASLLVISVIMPIQTERYFFQMAPLMYLLMVAFLYDVCRRIAGKWSVFAILFFVGMTVVMSLERPYYRSYFKSPTHPDGVFITAIKDRMLLVHSHWKMWLLGLYAMNAKNAIIFPDSYSQCYLDAMQKYKRSELAIISIKGKDCQHVKGWKLISDEETCSYLGVDD